MTAAAHPDTTFDVETLREEFPILRQRVRGHPLVYLDSAATSQKPQCVIDAVTGFYQHDNANIHRGVYQLSERATLSWDAARARVARFIGAADPGEVVFTRGTTEAVNLVAQSFLRPRLPRNRRVLVTAMEHHANIVPWQLAGAETVPIDITDQGELDMASAEALLAQGAALLAVTHVSNTLGTINRVAELCRMSHAAGVPVLIDGAQAVPHLDVDVQALDCDFYCFSGHKVFGPTGIGVLHGKREHLDAMPPYQGGGDMIDRVTFAGTTYAPAPGKFEAGTPHIAGAIGLAAALDWLDRQDREQLRRHEAALLERATALLSAIDGVRLIGHAADRIGVVTFVVDGAHPHDIASLLDGDGVCIRAGHHCTQPLHHRLGLRATARASFGPYTTHAEVDALAQSLGRAVQVLAG
jgi:cysteine desulfurase/selenocysteine lyase